MVSTGLKDSFREPNLKIFVKDVRETSKKRPIDVPSWSTIKDVKDLLKLKLNVPSSAIRLYFGPLLSSGRELPNHRTLHDAGIYRSGETLLLDISSEATSVRPTSADIRVSSFMIDSTPKSLLYTVLRARHGLSVGLKPDLALDGSGGTYVLRDARKDKVAVFKPSDEEPYAENNPRGYLRSPNASMSLRNGVAPGEACMREVAAFCLDHQSLSGVPATTLVEACHPAFNTNGSRLNVSQGGAALGAHSIDPQSKALAAPKKAGSFQEYVHFECTMDDISPSMLSVAEVHKIAILDIRIMNADRNPANLLVRRLPDNSLELVPIDHGFCLRSVCDVAWFDWCWLDWPQLKEPLSRAHKKYILSLDIEADATLLREQLNLCEEAVDYFRASSALLKAGVRAGLTLYDIAVLCCRNDNLAEVPSMMEKLFDMASELATVAVENERWHHATASRALVDQLQPRTPLPDSGRRKFGRSVSNAEFDSVRSLPDDEPGMAPSSVSECGSENEENEDDCDEWAAALIAGFGRQNMPVERASPVSFGESRSDCSILSSSPKGFWLVPPGAPEAVISDDASIQWSPKSTSRDTALTDISLEPPFSLDEAVAKTPPRVKFAKEPGPFLPPATVNVTKFSGGMLPLLDLDAPNATSMKRSKSYTAMTAMLGRGGSTSRGCRGPDKSSEGYVHYKKYFHKFIDLVIIRETTAALHQSRVTSS